MHNTVDCNVLTGGYDSFALSNIGFGGKQGRMSPGCPTNYTSLGLDCIRLPIQTPSSHEEMNSVCNEAHGSDSIPYSPRNSIQHAVLQGFLTHTVVINIELSF